MIGNPRKMVGRFRKSRPIIARQKSHALDPEKVGRLYMVVNLQETYVKGISV